MKQLTKEEKRIYALLNMCGEVTKFSPKLSIKLVENIIEMDTELYLLGG